MSDFTVSRTYRIHCRDSQGIDTQVRLCGRANCRLLIAVPNYLCFDLDVLGGFETFFSRFTVCQKFGSAAAISSEALL